MNEVWKDIKSYEGYQVSNFGRVRTHNKTTYTEKHGTRQKNIINGVAKKYRTSFVDFWRNFIKR